MLYMPLQKYMFNMHKNTDIGYTPTFQETRTPSAIQIYIYDNVEARNILM